MATPYTSQSASGYNSSPPADDGSQVTANRTTWAGLKSKLADPIKTLADNINAAAVSAFTKILGSHGVVTTAINYTVLSANQGNLIKVTASSVTVTTPSATDVGSPFAFAVVNNSTGNITIAGSGSQTIDGSATLTMPTGTGATFETDGTNWFTHGQNFAASTLAPVPGNFKNLSIKVASTTTVTAAADFVVVTDGTKFQTVAVNNTINLGTNGGLDALDTGTIAIDTWYYIWVIANTAGTVKCLASASSTAPTMPSGYTYKARIGAVQTIHGSATLYGTWQFGRKAQYVVGLAQTTLPPVIAAGVTGSTYSATSPTLVAVSVSRFVPPTASVIRLMAANKYAGGSQASVLVAPSTSYGGSNNGPSGSAGMVYPIALVALSAGTSANYTSDITLESTNLGYAADGAGGAIACLGWEDNL